MALNLDLVKREIRELLSLFVTNIKGQTAIGLSDLNRLSEGFLLELFREVYSLPGLRNLNREKQNVPGLDLGDDTAGRAFQITATPSLDKVKETLQTVVDAKLYERFRSIRISQLRHVIPATGTTVRTGAAASAGSARAATGSAETMATAAGAGRPGSVVGGDTVLVVRARPLLFRWD